MCLKRKSAHCRRLTATSPPNGFPPISKPHMSGAIASTGVKQAQVQLFSAHNKLLIGCKYKTAPIPMCHGHKITLVSSSYRVLPAGTWVICPRLVGYPWQPNQFFGSPLTFCQCLFGRQKLARQPTPTPTRVFFTGRKKNRHPLINAKFRTKFKQIQKNLKFFDRISAKLSIIPPHHICI